MTEPIELLQQRLDEIKQAKDYATENMLPEKELKKIQYLHDQYYVCISILKLGVREELCIKGIIHKSPMYTFVDQEKIITKLKRNLSKLKQEVVLV